jgi:hypothetical protein
MTKSGSGTRGQWKEMKSGSGTTCTMEKGDEKWFRDDVVNGKR